jgi:hypothetical protein
MEWRAYGRDDIAIDTLIIVAQRPGINPLLDPDGGTGENPKGVARALRGSEVVRAAEPAGRRVAFASIGLSIACFDVRSNFFPV